jgi:hypothetical protein
MVAARSATAGFVASLRVVLRLDSSRLRLDVACGWFFFWIHRSNKSSQSIQHWLICTQVESCAYESELRLLRAAAPRAPAEALVDASLLWRDLRGLVDEGRLSYPYSTRVPGVDAPPPSGGGRGARRRELVKVAKHLDAYPGDGLAAACADVFAFDGFDARLAALLATVLEGHGVDADEALGGGQSYGDMTLKLPEGFKTIKRPGAPAGMPGDGPKHGAWDDEAHMGGNMFAGARLRGCDALESARGDVLLPPQAAAGGAARRASAAAAGPTASTSASSSAT